MFRMLMIAIIAIPLIGTASFALTSGSTSPDACACGFCESGCDCCDGGACTCAACACPFCDDGAAEVTEAGLTATSETPSCCANGKCQASKTE